MTKEAGEEEKAEEDEEVSHISPASIPSNFLSIGTPSFGLSTVSSSDVSTHTRKKTQGGTEDENNNEEVNDGKKSPSYSRKYYSDTSSELLTWKVDTMRSFLGNTDV